MILSFSLTENFNKSSFKSLFMNGYLSFLTIRGTPGIRTKLGWECLLAYWSYGKTVTLVPGDNPFADFSKHC